MNIQEFSVDIMNKEFKLGYTDCFALTLKYIEGLGFKPPRKFKGVTKKTYPILYKKNPVKALVIMIEFLESFLIKIDPWGHNAGDIMLLRFDDSFFLAVNGGNGTIVASTEKYGVKLLPLKSYNIVGVYRWQH